MIAITKGSTSWRNAKALAANEVEFKGEFLYARDGMTPLMAWDAALGNVRAMTPAEIAAIPDAQAVSRKEEAAKAVDAAQTKDADASQRLIFALAMVMQDEINAVRAAVALKPLATDEVVAALKAKIGAAQDVAEVATLGERAAAHGHG